MTTLSSRKGRTREALQKMGIDATEIEAVMRQTDWNTTRPSDILMRYNGYDAPQPPPEPRQHATASGISAGVLLVVAVVGLVLFSLHFAPEVKNWWENKRKVEN